MPNRLKLAQEQSYVGPFWEITMILRTFSHTKARNVLIQPFLLLLFGLFRNQCNLTTQVSFECVQGGEIKSYRPHHVPFSQRSSKQHLAAFIPEKTSPKLSLLTKLMSTSL